MGKYSFHSTFFSVYCQEKQWNTRVDALKAAESYDRIGTIIGFIAVFAEPYKEDHFYEQEAVSPAAGCDAAAVIYGDAYVDIDGAGFGWAFASGRMAARAVVEDIK